MDKNFINFNDHIKKILPFNDYGGSEKKLTVILDDGLQYLFKFPDPTREKKRLIQTSYINNALSEYIGCKIFENTGIPVQKVILGEYTDERGKKKIACACLDLRGRDEELYDMEKRELMILDEVSIPTFENIKKTLYDMKEIDGEECYKRYCERFVVDAFIGNEDRHNGNWGFLYNKIMNETKLAPVYDCGSCLSPLYDDEELDRTFAVNQALNVVAAVREGNNRIHYKDFLLNTEDKDVLRAIRNIVPYISLEDTIKTIEEIPYLSEVRKDFYITMLTTRYEQVLIPAFERAIGLTASKEYKEWRKEDIADIYDTYIKMFKDYKDEGEYYLQAEVVACDEFKITDRNVFFFVNDECVGYCPIDKSKQNVGKFVQCARKLGMDIDKKLHSYNKGER